MKAKIFVYISTIYVKVAEEDCKDKEEVINKWKYASLIEFYDDKENLVDVYELEQ